MLLSISDEKCVNDSDLEAIAGARAMRVAEQEKGLEATAPRQGVWSTATKL